MHCSDIFGPIGWKCRIATSAFQHAAATVAGREHQADTSTLLNLAAGNRITAHDLEFVVLAQTVVVQLVTIDREVLAAFPAVAVRPADSVNSRRPEPPSA